MELIAAVVIIAGFILYNQHKTNNLNKRIEILNTKLKAQQEKNIPGESLSGNSVKKKIGRPKKTNKDDTNNKSTESSL